MLGVCFKCNRQVADEDECQFWPQSQEPILYCNLCLVNIGQTYLADVPFPSRNKQHPCEAADLEFGDDILCDSGDCWYQANMDRATSMYEISSVCLYPEETEGWICDHCLDEHRKCEACARYMVDSYPSIWLEAKGHLCTHWCVSCLDDAIDYDSKGSDDQRVYTEHLLTVEVRKNLKSQRKEAISELRTRLISSLDSYLQGFEDLPEDVFLQKQKAVEQYYVNFSPGLREKPL